MKLTDQELKSYAESGDEVVAVLVAEVMRLREGIREHQSKSGHELCWLNDIELWKLLDPDATYPHETLPVREELLTQCVRFYESRLKGISYEEPKPKQTVSIDKADQS
jgi:hypothetical protein